MSVCIRTISNKLPLPFVGSGKTVGSPVDRQLTKNVKKTTAFLEEFFGAGANFKNDTRVPTANCHFLVKPLETTSDNVVAWNCKLNAERSWSLRSNEKELLQEIGRKPLGKEIRIQHAASTIFATAEKVGVVNSQNESRPQAGDPADEKSQKEKLSHVYEVLRRDLPDFFVRSVDYSIYHLEIVFENNIKGTVTKGIYEYVKQTAMLRIIGHLKFAYVKFEVLKMTMHPEDNSVKVRWRIRGITGAKIFFNFWKYKVWKLQSSIDMLDSWYDGFSTFYVDIDSGKVVKHVADKMMPDQDRDVSEKDKTGMAAKLALFLGLLTPREFLADIAPLVNCSSKELEKSDATCREPVDSSLEKFE